jgi:hypothetical protein
MRTRRLMMQQDPKRAMRNLTMRVKRKKVMVLRRRGRLTKISPNGMNQMARNLTMMPPSKEETSALEGIPGLERKLSPSLLTWAMEGRASWVVAIKVVCRSMCLTRPLIASSRHCPALVFQV